MKPLYQRTLTPKSSESHQISSTTQSRWFWVLLFGLMASCFTFVQAQNLLDNPSFETGNLNHWQNNNAKTVTGHNQCSSTYAAWVNHTGSSSSSLNYISQEVNASAGKKYELTFRAQQRQTGHNRVRLQALNSSGDILAETNTNIDESSWRSWEVILEGTPDGTDKIKVIVETSNGGQVKVDCFDLRESTAPSYSKAWSFDCEDGEVVDVYDSPADCAKSRDSEIDIPSSLSVTRVVVEVVYKSDNPGSSVTAYADGNAFTLSQIDIQGGSSGVRVYRGEYSGNIGNVYHNSATGNCGNSKGLQSLVVYAFRDQTANVNSAGQFTSISGYCDIQGFVIGIPTESEPRDITVKLPISELTTDGRYITVEATAGNVTAKKTIYGPPSGTCCVDIVEVTLNNVPGNVKTVAIDVDTRKESHPNGTNKCGQSYVISGGVSVETECPEEKCDDFYALAEVDLNEVITRTIDNNHPVCGGGSPDQVFYANCLFTTGCSGDLEQWKRVGSSSFTEYTDGTALLTMTIENVDNSNYQFDVEVIFDGRTQTPPAGSPKLGICTSTTKADWYYYTVTKGSLIGKMGLSGAVLAINRKSSSFQVGTGASLYDPNSFGASGWLNYNILEHPTAFHLSDNAGLDFNFELSGGAFDFGATAEEICPGEKATLEAFATGGTPPYTYKWNQGLGNGKTKMVNPTTTTTYRVTITDSKGCEGTDDVVVTVKDCSSLGDFVWIDANGNGRQDVGENGLDGVKVELKNNVGTVIQTQFTMGGGKYLFEGLSAGTYSVQFTAPSGYVITQQNVGSDDKDSDANPGTGMTGNYTLGNEETNLTVDAGLYKPASLGDFVFLDENKNGIQDGGEKGLKNIQVRLFNEKGQNIKTTNTNSNGLYFFGDLVPGKYYVKFALPSGLMFTLANQGNNDTRDSDVDDANGSGTTQFYTLSSGEYDPDIDAGAKCLVEVDAGNDQTICEGTCADLSATASKGSGSYTYTWSHGLGSGKKKTVCPTSTTTYTVTVSDVDGCCLAEDKVKVTVKGCIDLQLIKSVDDKTPVAGEYVTFTIAVKNDGPSTATGVQIKDFIPNGYDDISNISGGGSLSGSTIIWNNKTIANGATLSLTFRAQVLAPGAGVDYNNIAEITKADQEDDDSTPGNGADTDGDGKIGPLDNDGSQDADDEDDGDDEAVSPSCDLVADAGPDASVCSDQCHDLEASATGGSGTYYYEWDNGLGVSATHQVCPTKTTTYTVTVTDLVTGCKDTDKVTVTVHPDVKVDAGANQIICERECADLTATPSAGKAPYTYKWSNGKTTKSINVCPTRNTTYKVTVTDDNGCTAEDQVTVETKICGSIGDFVWEDKNGNGQQDVGENGISGVKVTLTDGVGTPIKSERTDANGKYLFDTLDAGNYMVLFELPAGYDAFTSANVGPDATDSDANTASGKTGVINLSQGENDLTNDAGVYKYAALGDYVWEDINKDGLQQFDEPGINGIEVKLKDDRGSVISTTTTASKAGKMGFYEFSDLAPGKYTVMFMKPNDGVFTKQNAGNDGIDSDADPVTGNSPLVTLASGDNNTTIDAGITFPIDLQLVKKVNDKTPVAGEYVTFTIEVKNNGPADATGVQIKDFIPNGYDDISNISAGGSLSGSTITWNNKSIANGATLSLTFRAQVLAPGAGVDYNNIAEITKADQDDSDSTPGNGADTDGDGKIGPLDNDGSQDADDEDDGDDESVNPQTIDLQLVKSVNDKTPNVGDVVTFTIAVRNNGPANATGVQIKDFVPNGYSGITNISGGGSLSGNTITWNNKSISNGATLNLTFRARVNTPGVGVNYNNIAEITDADQFDSDSEPNNGADTDGDGKIGPLDNDGSQDADDEDDGDDETVEPQVIDLQLVKSVNNKTPNVGDFVVFTVAVKNNGPASASGVQIKDVVPTGYSDISNISHGGSLSGSTITWNDKSIPNGTTLTLTFRARVNAPGVGIDYNNIAEVTDADQFDSDSEPNNGADTDGDGKIGPLDNDGSQDGDDEDDGDDESVDPQVIDLQLIKMVNNSTPSVGEVVTFTISVTNSGPSNATGVEIKDFVPNGYSNISGISSGGVLSGNTITWSNKNISNGGTLNLTFRAEVNAPGNGIEYDNIAEITNTDQYDSDSEPGNGADTDGDGDIGPIDNDGSQDSDDEDDGDNEGVQPKVIDLELVKSVNDKTPNAGDYVTFTIAVTNNGPSNATGVQIMDVVPNGYNDISNISSGGSLSGSTVTWSGQNIANGATVNYTFRARVLAPGAGVDYQNIAEITKANEYDIDSEPGNGADTDRDGDIGPIDNDGSQDADDEDDGDDEAVSPTCDLVADAGPDASVCSDQCHNLRASATGGSGSYYYQWDNGLGVSAAHQVCPTRTTTYTVTVTDLVTGCKDTDKVTVTVFPDVQVDAGANQTVCKNECANLTASPSAGRAPYTYEWSTGDKTQTIEVCPSRSTTYRVTVTDKNGCTAEDQVTVETKVCGSIGNFVWEDRNGNGQQDIGEPGIPGVKVTLTDGVGTPIKSERTNADGEYLFDTLDAGNYMVLFELPAGYDAFTTANNGNDSRDSDADVTGKTGVISLSQGENDLTVDAGVFNLTSLGDYVWEDLNADGVQDAGEPGVNGVQVALRDNRGSIIATTTTRRNLGQDGYYEFVDLIPGTYSVRFTTPSGYLFTSANSPLANDTNDSDANILSGTSSNTTLLSGEHDPTIDAGLIRRGQIGDFVWDDKNGNGIQDFGEEGKNGVIVYLFEDNNKDGRPEGLVETQITRNNAGQSGYYQFTDLMPGNYVVQFDSPQGCIPSPNNAVGSNDSNDSDASISDGLTPTIMVQSGTDNQTIDAGFFDPICLGDYVWEDENHNGRQDANETGINGVVVELYEVGVGLIESQTTGDNPVGGNPGFYKFDIQKPGNYYISFDASIVDSRYETTLSNNAGDVEDSDLDNSNGPNTTRTYSLEGGDNNLTVDAGFWLPSSLGNYVWEDRNMDGIQNDGISNGLNGIRVELVEEATGFVVGTQFTGPDPRTGRPGYYCFEDLIPEAYFVRFAVGNNNLIPTDAKATNDAQDSDLGDSNGPMTTSTVVLGAGEDNKDVDAGFFQPSKIGDYVFEDHGEPGKLNGIQDDNESGLAGTTVTLYSPLTMAPVPGISPIVTGADGFYQFCVKPGNYYVKFDPPGGYISSPANATADDKDSDVENTFGPNTTKAFSIGYGEENPTIDAGFHDKALPVQLISFTAELVQGVTYLHWLTAQEANSDYFEVERKHETESGWKSIGQVSAKGNSTSLTDYQLEDHDLFDAGVYYYRLKQVDFNGDYERSQIVSVNLETSQNDQLTMAVFPNPTTTTAIIQFNEQLSEDVEVVIIGMDGRKWSVANAAISANQIQINVSDIPNGQYQIQVYYRNQVYDQIITVLK